MKRVSHLFLSSNRSHKDSNAIIGKEVNIDREEEYYGIYSWISLGEFLSFSACFFCPQYSQLFQMAKRVFLGLTVAISTGGSTTQKMSSGNYSFIATFCTYVGSLIIRTLQSLKLT